MQRRRRILCIEDDPGTGELLTEILEEEGFEVELATTGPAGLAKAQTRPDVILCDIGLPGLSGLEVLSRLRSAQGGLSRIPVVMITALKHREEQIKARRLGCDDFVTKPIDFELLIAIVRHRLTRADDAASADEPGFRLTDREAEVLTWVARGKSSADIGTVLGVGERTVNFHVENIIRKVGVATRVQAALKCAQFGLISP